MFDWILTVFIWVLSQILISTITPFERNAPANDGQLNYPHKENSVPIWLDIFVSIVFPILIIVGYQCKFKSFEDLHFGCLSLLIGTGTSNILTQIAKLYAGRLRPDWWVRQTISQETVDAGRLSYISGHTSLAFSGCTFLSLYLIGKLKLFNNNNSNNKDGNDEKSSSTTWISNEKSGKLWKFFIILLPQIVAFLIGISRTRDYRHNFSDINAGAFVGFVSAIMTYFLYYPSFFDKHCDLPRNSIMIPSSSPDNNRLNV